jgi:thioredoxin-related protein
MRHILIVFSLIISTSLIASSKTTDGNGVVFYSASVEEAKSLAGSMGKLAFIEFYATWCGPCKWMDQTTFSNATVSNLLNENYIAIKVNIEEFDGFEEKEKYNVSALPTMIIFNSKGKMVDKIEETLPPSKMVQILEKHDKKSNRTVIRHKTNSSPTKLSPHRESTRTTKTVRNAVSSSSRYTTSKPVRPDKYRVWVGTFRDQTSAHNYNQVLKQTFLDPIYVVKDIVSANVIYKVYMGEFQTRSEAEDYQRILKNEFNIDGKLE